MTKKKQLIKIQDAPFIYWDITRGEKLKEKRLEKKLTFKQLSALIEKKGCTFFFTYIPKLEAGKIKMIDTNKLLALLNALGTDIDTFLK